MNTINHAILKVTGQTYNVFAITNNGNFIGPTLADSKKREFFELQIELNKLQEIDATQVIEQHYMHAEILKDVKTSKYYQLI